MASRQKFPTLKGKLRSESFGGLIFCMEPLRILAINQIAYEIAAKLNGLTTIRKISSKLAERYSYPELAVQRDVEGFLSFLAHEGLLEGWGKRSKIPNLSRMQKERYNQHPLIGMYDFELNSPISVLIEITRECNLRCLHCFSNSGEGVTYGELTTAEWKQFIKTLADMGVFLVFFGGGEPLCHKDFIEVAEYTKELGIEMCLLSNLTLINANLARKIHDIGFYKVEGNLDGHTAEIYERLRNVPGSFKQTIDGIRHCVDAGLPVRINCTLTQVNYHYLEEITKLAYSLGVTDIAFIRLIPAGRGNDNFEKLDIGERLYSDHILPNLKSLRVKYKGKINIGYEQDDELIALSDPNKAMPWCGSGRIHCTVTPNGLVKPDHSFPDDDPRVIAGNILQNNFSEIWQKAPVFKVIRHTRFKECNGCKHIQCAGGDVYRIYCHYGQIMGGIDPRCTGKKVEAYV